MRKTALSVLIVGLWAVSALSQQLSFNPAINNGWQFEDTEINAERTLSTTVMPQNDDGREVNVQVQSNNNAFIVQPANFQVSGERFENLQVTFRPNQAQNYNATITITASINNMQRPVVYQFNVSGRGLPLGDPEISLDPREFNWEVVEEDQRHSGEFTISNSGESDLEIRVRKQADSDWLDLENLEFNVAPNESRTVEFAMTDNLPEDGEYQYRIRVFSNDPENELINVYVNLTVSLIDLSEERTIRLTRGWNLISSNVIFGREMNGDDGPDVRNIFAQIMDRIEIGKDGNGRFFLPNFNFWGLMYWDLKEGYLIKVTEDVDFNFVGIPIPQDQEIELSNGWNMIAFYPNEPMRMDEAFGDLVEQNVLYIAKKGDGSFFMPSFNHGGNVVIQPGEGVLIRVTNAASFSYPIAE